MVHLDEESLDLLPNNKKISFMMLFDCNASILTTSIQWKWIVFVLKKFIINIYFFDVCNTTMFMVKGIANINYN